MSQSYLAPQSSDPEAKSHEGVSFLTQTKLLFVKNWLSKKRTEPKKLFGELCLPIFYLLMLSLLVGLQNRTTFPEDKQPYEIPVNILDSFFANGQYEFIVHIIHPSTDYTEKIISMIQEVWKKSGNGRPDPLRFNKSFLDEKSLMDAYFKGSSIKMAIILPQNETSLSYTIRINPDQAVKFKLPLASEKTISDETCRDRTNKLSKFELEDPSTCPVNGYYYANFLALQYLIDQALIMRFAKYNPLKNIKDSLNITIENYPKAKYTADMSLFLRIYIPLFCVIPLAQFINTLLILIVTEKKAKIKDGLRMIGVSDAAYWFSWFGIYGIMSTIFAFMFTIVMHYMNVLKNANPVVLFLLFLLFGLSVITFAFALTPFFHKPETAGAVGNMVLILTSTLFLLQTFVKGSSSMVLIPLRLISSLAFTTAIDTACEFEFQGGISLVDILPGERGSSILYSLIFLLFDTILYGLIAMYLDNVIPNEYGIRKHPLFFLNPSYWFGKKLTIRKTGSLNENERTMSNSKNFEKVDQSLLGKEAIRIRNLRKTYGSWQRSKTVEAVKEVSMDIYEGQITAILGRNGAGKSTLVNMMTGLVTPTSGSCIVFGLDISDPYDMACLRKMTGVCMQQDLHFQALTTQEHLEFYGKLRGIDAMSLKSEINSLLEELQLTDQANTASSKLSGGQKRKLSIGIALIGSPKIILLDEPSAGVDPLSRRHLWSLLQSKKEGRVILLTTHFMDEADVLSDRKAIIHDGRVKCMGSSLFLKKQFGVGYHLTVEMKERNPDFRQSDSLVEKYIPDAIRSKKITANEIKYSLPHSKVDTFPELFGKFEAEIKSKSSHIMSYGVSMTTLEEVFLKISTDMDIEKGSIMPHRRGSSSSSIYSSDRVVTNEEGDQLQNQDNPEFNINENENLNLIPNLGETNPSWIHILFAMCAFRVRRQIRNPLKLFFMIVMPVILATISFTIINSQNVSFNEKKLDFSVFKGIEIYPKPELNIAVLENDMSFNTFITNTNVFNPKSYSGDFSDLLYTNPGVGTLASVVVPLWNNATTSVNYNVRINGTYLQSPGIILNLISQHYISTLRTESQKLIDIPTITTTNHPLPSKITPSYDQTSFYAAFLIGPAFTYVALGLVMEIVNDKEIKARNHLRVNGLTFQMYFYSLLIVFSLMYIFVILMEIGVLCAINVKPFTISPWAIFVLVILLVLFILPCLLLSSIFSYLFDRLESAQSVFSQVSYFMAYIFGLAMILVDGLVPTKALIVHSVFCAIDVFYIPFGIFFWVNKQYLACTASDTCDKLSFKNYLGPEILIMGGIMLIQIPIFGVILMIVDIIANGGRVSVMDILGLNLKKAITKRRVSINSSRMDIVSEDEDVKAEKDRVSDFFSSDQRSKCVVAVQDLHKSYVKKSKIDGSCIAKSHQKKVLHGVSFLIKEGEVFGLLGHNGAGKTSTMKIIIAEEATDSGRVWLCGYDIQSNISEAFTQLGYCPQHDALWDDFTLREHLELYSVIRGVKPNLKSKLVNHFLKGLQIEEHAEKKSKELSGGTKRKLTYCLSMLGSPKIVLLDEPSCGMDVSSKRFLWNTVLGTFKDSRGAILTTHSMEEADALCTKIAIMVKGSLLCVGSPQHLKSKYGAGYTLEIKMKVDRAEEYLEQELVNTELVVKKPTDVLEKFKFVQEHFPSSKLSEIFNNRAVFSIPKTKDSLSISETFALLERLKQDYNVEDYSFSQTTLEQVFLQFAKDNEDESDST